MAALARCSTSRSARPSEFESSSKQTRAPRGTTIAPTRNVSCRAVLFRCSLVMAATCALTGCYAEATTGAEVEYAPPVANVEVYPHEYYDGRVVYLVNDRWYYREGPHWVYYRSEPPVLYERRTVIRTQPTV